MNAVGAHPIESWLGPDQLEACGIQTFNHGTRHFFALFGGNSLVPVFVFAVHSFHGLDLASFPFKSKASSLKPGYRDKDA